MPPPNAHPHLVYPRPPMSADFRQVLFKPVRISPIENNNSPIEHNGQEMEDLGATMSSLDIRKHQGGERGKSIFHISTLTFLTMVFKNCFIEICHLFYRIMHSRFHLFEPNLLLVDNDHHRYKMSWESAINFRFHLLQPELSK